MNVLIMIHKLCDYYNHAINIHWESQSETFKGFAIYSTEKTYKFEQNVLKLIKSRTWYTSLEHYSNPKAGSMVQIDGCQTVSVSSIIWFKTGFNCKLHQTSDSLSCKWYVKNTCNKVETFPIARWSPAALANAQLDFITFFLVFMGIF